VAPMRCEPRIVGRCHHWMLIEIRRDCAGRLFLARDPRNPRPT
jgi:hypothetical protein